MSYFTVQINEYKNDYGYFPAKSNVYQSVENVCHQINHYGLKIPKHLKWLSRVGVQGVAVGDRYFAFHLFDGRICRFSYTMDCGELVQGRSTKIDSDNKGAKKGASTVSSNEQQLSDTSQQQRFSDSVPDSYNRASGRSSRGYNLLREMQRSGLLFRSSLGVSGSSSAIPASEIPENLVQEAMQVLQGKSRQVIVRELQRTNLDVNLAVNNLLSREEGELSPYDDIDMVSAAPSSGAAVISAGGVTGDSGTGLLALSSSASMIPTSIRMRDITGNESRSRSFYSSTRAWRYRSSDGATRSSRGVFSERGSSTQRQRQQAQINERADELRSSNALDPFLRGYMVDLDRYNDDEAEELLGLIESGITTNDAATNSVTSESNRERFYEMRLMDDARRTGRFLRLPVSGTSAGGSQPPTFNSMSYTRRPRRNAMIPQSQTTAEKVRRRIVDVTRTGNEGSTSDTNRSENNTKKSESTAVPETATSSTHFTAEDAQASELNKAIKFGTTVQWWCDPLDDGTPMRFKAMSSMYSELIAIRSDDGQLAQWRWDSAKPYASTVDENGNAVTVYHPRATELHLVGCRIKQLSCSILRSTILTENGELATWVDQCIQAVAGSRLEHSTKHPVIADTDKDPVRYVTTSCLTSVALTKSGAVYYWGVKPPGLRCNTPRGGKCRTDVLNTGSAVEQQQQQQTHNFQSGSSSGVGIKPGTFVCMRSAPLYHSGAVGFTLQDGVPRIGTLLEDAWNSSAICRFQVHPAHPPNCRNDESTWDNMQQHDMYHSDHHKHVCPLLQRHQKQALRLNTACTDVSYSSPASGDVLSTSAGLLYRPQLTLQGGIPSEIPSSEIAGSSAGSSSQQQERNEMPPPPSPASSTCSEQGGSRVKRRYRPLTQNSVTSPRNTSTSAASSTATVGPGSKTENGRNVRRPFSLTWQAPVEEDWRLSDVIFLEDGRTQPVGIVLKVDSGACIVKFLKEQERACLLTNCPMAPDFAKALMRQTTNAAEDEKDGNINFTDTVDSAALQSLENLDWFRECRLKRQEDLIVVRHFARAFPVVQQYGKLVHRLGREHREVVALSCSNGHVDMAVVVAQRLSQGCVNGTPVQHSDLQLIRYGFDGKCLSIYRLHNNPVGYLSLTAQSSLKNNDILRDSLADGASSAGGELPCRLIQLQLQDDGPFYVEQQLLEVSKNTVEERLKTEYGTSPLNKLPECLFVDGEGFVHPYMTLLPEDGVGLPDDDKAIHSRHRVVETFAGQWLDQTPFLSLSLHSVRPSFVSKTTVSTSSGSGTTSSGRAILSQHQQFQKRRRFMTVALLRRSVAMEPVLRQDVKEFQHLLGHLDKSKTDPEQRQRFRDVLLRERTDGNRNLVHAIVMQCRPLLLTAKEEIEFNKKIRQALGIVTSYRVFAMQMSIITAAAAGGVHPDDALSQDRPSGAVRTCSEFKSASDEPPLSLNDYDRLVRTFRHHSESQDGSSKDQEQDNPTLGHLIGDNITNESESSRSLAKQHPTVGSDFQIYPMNHYRMEKTRCLNAHVIMRSFFEALLLEKGDPDSSSSSMKNIELLASLLLHRDAQFLTPFQVAVKIGAYAAALFLWDIINLVIGTLKLSSSTSSAVPARENLYQYLFPWPVFHLDDSPLFILCNNDPCTFLWTGAQHISQSIFECRTCKLTEFLCCCLECARKCHRFHDCRIKRRTNPTAYCDCWGHVAGSRCQCLAQGDQQLRFDLFCRLLRESTFYQLPNERGEHILVHLVSTAERLQNERQSLNDDLKKHGKDGNGGSRRSRRTSGAPSRLDRIIPRAVFTSQPLGWPVSSGGSQRRKVVRPSSYNILHGHRHYMPLNGIGRGAGGANDNEESDAYPDVDGEDIDEEDSPQDGSADDPNDSRNRSTSRRGAAALTDAAAASSARPESVVNNSDVRNCSFLELVYGGESILQQRFQPRHDLSVPKFAYTALEYSLRHFYPVIRSLFYQPTNLIEDLVPSHMHPFLPPLPVYGSACFEQWDRFIYTMVAKIDGSQRFVQELFDTVYASEKTKASTSSAALLKSTATGGIMRKRGHCVTNSNGTDEECNVFVMPHLVDAFLRVGILQHIVLPDEAGIFTSPTVVQNYLPSTTVVASSYAAAAAEQSDVLHASSSSASAVPTVGERVQQRLRVRTFPVAIPESSRLRRRSGRGVGLASGLEDAPYYPSRSSGSSNRLFRSYIREVQKRTALELLHQYCSRPSLIAERAADMIAGFDSFLSQAMTGLTVRTAPLLQLSSIGQGAPAHQSVSRERFQNQMDALFVREHRQSAIYSQAAAYRWCSTFGTSNKAGSAGSANLLVGGTEAEPADGERERNACHNSPENLPYTPALTPLDSLVERYKTSYWLGGPYTRMCNNPTLLDILQRTSSPSETALQQIPFYVNLSQVNSRPLYDKMLGLLKARGFVFEESDPLVQRRPMKRSIQAPPPRQEKFPKSVRDAVDLDREPVVSISHPNDSLLLAPASVIGDNSSMVFDAAGDSQSLQNQRELSTIRQNVDGNLDSILPRLREMSAEVDRLIANYDEAVAEQSTATLLHSTEHAGQHAANNEHTPAHEEVVVDENIMEAYNDVERPFEEVNSSDVAYILTDRQEHPSYYGGSVDPMLLDRHSVIGIEVGETGNYSAAVIDVDDDDHDVEDDEEFSLMEGINEEQDGEPEDDDGEEDDDEEDLDEDDGEDLHTPHGSEEDLEEDDAELDDLVVEDEQDDEVDSEYAPSSLDDDDDDEIDDGEDDDDDDDNDDDDDIDDVELDEIASVLYPVAEGSDVTAQLRPLETDSRSRHLPRSRSDTHNVEMSSNVDNGSNRNPFPSKSNCAGDVSGKDTEIGISVYVVASELLNNPHGTSRIGPSGITRKSQESRNKHEHQRQPIYPGTMGCDLPTTKPGASGGQESNISFYNSLMSNSRVIACCFMAIRNSLLSEAILKEICAVSPSTVSRSTAAGKSAHATQLLSDGSAATDAEMYSKIFEHYWACLCTQAKKLSKFLLGLQDQMDFVENELVRTMVEVRQRRLQSDRYVRAVNGLFSTLLLRQAGARSARRKKRNKVPSALNVIADNNTESGGGGGGNRMAASRPVRRRQSGGNVGRHNQSSNSTNEDNLNTSTASSHTAQRMAALDEWFQSATHESLLNASLPNRENPMELLLSQMRLLTGGHSGRVDNVMDFGQLQPLAILATAVLAFLRDIEEFERNVIGSLIRSYCPQLEAEQQGESTSNSQSQSSSAACSKSGKKPSANSLGPRPMLFFQRSESTLELDQDPLDVFQTKSEQALPLAHNRNLLDGRNDRNVLFGFVSSPAHKFRSHGCSNFSTLARERFPRQVLSNRFKYWTNTVDRSFWNFSYSGLLHRWCWTLRAFNRIFGGDFTGREGQNTVLGLTPHQSYRTKERSFRNDMDRLRTLARGFLPLEVTRGDRLKFIFQTMISLDLFYDSETGGCIKSDLDSAGLTTSTNQYYNNAPRHYIDLTRPPVSLHGTAPTIIGIPRNSSRAGFGNSLDAFFENARPLSRLAGLSRQDMLVELFPLNFRGTSYGNQDLGRRGMGAGNDGGNILPELIQRGRLGTTSGSVITIPEQPLLVSRIKVWYTEETGEGNGVLRSFLDQFAKEISCCDKPLPYMQHLQPLRADSKKTGSVSTVDYGKGNPTWGAHRDITYPTSLNDYKHCTAPLVDLISFTVDELESGLRLFQHKVIPNPVPFKSQPSQQQPAAQQQQQTKTKMDMATLSETLDRVSHNLASPNLLTRTQETIRAMLRASGSCNMYCIDEANSGASKEAPLTTKETSQGSSQHQQQQQMLSGSCRIQMLPVELGAQADGAAFDEHYYYGRLLTAVGAVISDNAELCRALTTVLFGQSHEQIHHMIKYPDYVLYCWIQSALAIIFEWLRAASAHISSSTAAASSSSVTPLSRYYISMDCEDFLTYDFESTSTATTSARICPVVAFLDSQDQKRISDLVLRQRKHAIRYASLGHHHIGFSSNAVRVQFERQASPYCVHESPSVNPIEIQPLFWKPCKNAGRSFLSPRGTLLFKEDGNASYTSSLEVRLAMYRNVGRVIGLAFLSKEFLPLPLGRHVLKYLLQRDTGWHDMAFLDHECYEHLRKLFKMDSADLDALELTFEITLSQEEAGLDPSIPNVTIELKKSTDGEGPLRVNKANLHEYVRAYCLYRMFVLIQRPLEAMRRGLLDVLPSQALEGLTAEDLTLLLCGRTTEDVRFLRSITQMTGELGSNPSLEQTKRLKEMHTWFWKIVEDMTNEQKADLLLFWTASYCLATDISHYSPKPSVVFRPPDDARHPSANTCVYRIYIPLYSSKELLRLKLLEAIAVKDFGFV